MCGCAGAISYKDRRLEDLNHWRRNIVGALSHRGPDDHGVYQDQHALLVHDRLAIISPEDALQPMVSADGRYVLIYNGEVYNYRSLRDELREHWNFQTESDTEVVMAALVRWGPAALDRFNGMFALMLWDNQKKIGFAARDLMGVKPLFYHHSGQELLFASEVHTLAQMLPKRRLNSDVLLEYWLCPQFSCSIDTAIDGVRALPGGHWMAFDREGVLRIECWQDYLPVGSVDKVSPDLVADLAGRMQKAVELTLRADVPICAELSGGLDSTTVAAYAKAASTSLTDAYTILYENQSEYDYSQSLIVEADDFPYAQSASQALNLNLQPVEVKRAELVDALKKMARINGLIPVWELESTHYFLARSISEHYKVALIGDVADETHFGYHFMLDPKATSSFKALCQRFSEPNLAKHITDQKINDTYARLEARMLNAGYCWGSELDNQLATTYAIVKQWLPRLLLNSDHYLMHFGVEARVPFADRDLLALSAKILPSLGFHQGEEKHLLRRAVKGVTPENVRTRKKSAIPKDQWAQSVYQQSAKEALANGVGDYLSGVIDLKQVKAWIVAPSLTPQQSYRLFQVAVFGHWAEAHLA